MVGLHAIGKFILIRRLNLLTEHMNGIFLLSLDVKERYARTEMGKSILGIPNDHFYISALICLHWPSV